MTAHDFPTLLRELVEQPGISGHEDAIASFMARRLADYTGRVTIDALSNVTARVGDGAGRRVAVLAHMDTVGMLVNRTNSDGTPGIVPVGGINFRALPGASVWVGDLPGTVGVRSQHLAKDREDAPSADNLYLDVGAGVEVEITTPVRYSGQGMALAGGIYTSPYMDNRAGCAVLLETARLLGRETGHTVYFIGTVQEETTCAGAYHALQAVAPDAAIFVDGTLSYDTPDTRGRGAVALGQGPVLTAFLYVSGLNGWHAHPGLRAHLKEVARENGIPYQQDAVRGLISDARVATWLAVPSAIIGLPMRGKHAPLETVHLDDLASATRLLLAVLRRPLPDLKRG